MSDLASDFYSGLIAQLYELLAGDLAETERFARFVKKTGTPALELACGAGHPMLALVAQGYEVWGIDSSEDMLAQCRTRAHERGLQIHVQLQLMQELDLPQKFASCYIAGASFCLMDTVEDAQETLHRVFRHLSPGGRFLLSAFRPALLPQPGKETSRVREDGLKISVQSVAQEELVDRQLVITRLLYCVRQEEQLQQQVERNWKVRWYRKDQLCSMLESAGFSIESAYDFDGRKSAAESCNFSIVARV